MRGGGWSRNDSGEGKHGHSTPFGLKGADHTGQEKVQARRLYYRFSSIQLSVSRGLRPYLVKPETALTQPYPAVT